MGAFSGAIGSLWVEVGAKIQKFEAGMAAVSKQVDATYKDVEKTFGGFDKLGASLSGVGKSLTLAVTAPLVGVGIAATKMADDFQGAMNRVSALGEITGKDLKTLESLAIELGAKTKFSATEAAQGMAELSAAGLNTKQIMATIPAVMDLAAAGQISIAQASTIATDAISQFSLKVTDSAHVADVLAKAAASGKDSVQGIGVALSYVGGPASAAGISLEQTAAALTLMAEGGLKGERAGTALRSILVSLNKPSKEAADLMEQMGLKIEGTGGKMRPIADIVDDLSKRNLSLAQAATLVGEQGATGLLNLSKLGGSALNKLAGDLSNADGSAKQMASTLQQGLPGALEKAKGSIETAGITIGQALAPTIVKLAEALESAANKVAEFAQWFNDLPDPIKNATLTLVAFSAALGPLTFGLGQVLSSITSLYKGFGLLTEAGGIVKVLSAGLASATPIAIAFGVAIAGWALYEAITKLREVNTELDRLYDLQTRGVKAGEEQRKKIAQLETVIASYNKQIGNQRISVDATGKSIEEYTKALEQAVQTIQKTAGASQKYETGLEGIRVITGKVKQETDKGTQGYREHKKSVEEVGKAMATVADDVGPRLTKRFELLDEISRQLQSEHQQHVAATAKLTIELGRMADGIEQASRATEGLVQDMAAIPGGMQNVSSMAPQFGQDIADAIGFGLPKIEEVEEELEELAETGKASVEDFSTKSQDTFSTWAKQVSTIITDAGKNIFRRFAEAGDQNKRLDEDAAKLRESLADREQSYAEFAANTTAKLAEANADYQETLAKEEQSLRESLAERKLDYEEFAASVADKLAEFTKKNAEQADKEKQSLLDSLEDRTRDYEDYKGDVEDRIKDIRDSHAKSAKKETRTLQESLVDRKKDYERYVEDVNTRLQRIRAKNKGQFSEEEQDLLVSLRRRTEDFNEYQEEVASRIIELSRRHQEEAAKQEQDQRDALARRERDYKLYQDEIAKKLNDVTVKHQEAQLKEEADLKASLEKKKAELDKYNTEASAKFEGTRAAAAAKLAEQEADLKASLAKQTSEWEKFTTDVNAQLQSIEDKHLGIFGKLASVGVGIFKDLGEAVGRFVAEELIGKLFKSLADLVSDILPGVGKALGGIFGSGGAAAGAAGQVGGAAGGAGSAAGGAAGAAGGFASIAGAIGSIGSLVTGVIGNFQNARQENTLNAIEESTRYVKIWTGETSQSLLWCAQKSTEYLGYLNATADGLGKKLDEWLAPSMNSLQQIAESIPLAQARFDSIANDVHWGSMADRDNTSVLHTLRDLLGMNRTPQITVYVNGVAQPASAVSLKMQGILV
jgi:TP901 family phage tail tape measure protein